MKIFRDAIKPNSKVRLDYTHKDLPSKFYAGNDIELHDNLDFVQPYVTRATEKELHVNRKQYGTRGIYTIMD